MVTPEAPGELTFEARNASGRVLVRMPVWVR
jgi:hypothetical protein